MKKTILLFLACIIGLTGCSKSIPQPTMEQLLAEVNAEHKAIEKPEVGVEQYSQYISTRSPIEQSLQPAAPAEDGGMSLGQAEFDLNLLFDSLHKNYGLYDFYGGDAVFETARQQAIEDCKNADKLNADVIRQIIKDNLSFITDMHFRVDGEHIGKSLYPCFFTEVQFQKTQDGTYTAKGKTVESVESQDDLDELFKRSLTKEGEIVYYPITFADPETAEKQPPSITVHYTDGTSQVITAQPYEPLQPDPEMEVVERHETEGITVQKTLLVNSSDFSAPAEELGKEKVSIMDLTSNRGGNPQFVFAWWKDYLGRQASGNQFSIIAEQGVVTSGFSEEQQLLGIQTMDNMTLLYTHEDDFIEQDNLLIILTSKNTASASEIFTDIAHNVQNTLIIGENTVGCLTSNLNLTFKLTYSGIEIGFGNAVTIFPENYFEEGYGFEPDLWCPAVYAEQAAVNLVKNLTK